MNLNEFSDEYGNLSEERQKLGLETLFEIVVSDVNRYKEFIDDILISASMFEDEDYFGTEGLNV